MATRRERWSEARARAVFEELARSGESDGAYCERHGIGRHRLMYWRKRLIATKPSQAFVPIEIPAEIPNDKTCAARTPEITIRMGDIVITAYETNDVDFIARLVVACRRRTVTC